MLCGDELYSVSYAISWVQTALRTTWQSLYFQFVGKVNDSSKTIFIALDDFALYCISLFLAKAILLKAAI